MVQAKCLANALLHWAPWFSLLSISWLVPSVAFQMVQIRTRMIQAGRSAGGQVLGAQLTSKLGQTAQNLVWCSTKRLQGWRARKRSGLPATVLNHFSCSFISSSVSQAAVSDFDISSFCFAPLRRVWLCPPCNLYPQGSWKQQWDALCLLLSVLNKQNSLSPPPYMTRSNPNHLGGSLLDPHHLSASLLSWDTQNGTRYSRCDSTSAT